MTPAAGSPSLPATSAAGIAHGLVGVRGRMPSAIRRAAWFGLLALAACATPPSPASSPVAATVPASPAVCRVGPDGTRPLADRGIGGTGSPAVQTADRGIGGTGIIGVITGFASVCVAGEEVALPASLAAQIDGKPGTLDDLRAGQVVAVQAAGPAGSLLAREIAVRHVVIGPVQAVGNGMLTVAGQQVLVGDAAGSATYAVPGQFVAVSGLRQPGGLIVATRIDPAPPGPVLLRGDLVRIYGSAQIGAQVLRLPDANTTPGGFPVVVTGAMQGDVLVVDSLARDIADQSPAAYFGPSVSNFVVEGYWAAIAGGYFVSRDFVRGGRFVDEARGRGIASFSRGADGGLVGRDMPAREGGGGAGLRRGFGVAPMPNDRGPGRAQGFGGSGLGGAGGGAGFNGTGFGGTPDQGRDGPSSRFPTNGSGNGGFGGFSGQGGGLGNGPQAPMRR